MNNQAISEHLKKTFERHFQEGLEQGASLALYHRGENIMSLHAGWRDLKGQEPWTQDTLAPVWSAGKGVASACLLHALQEQHISIDTRVATLWPEFAQAGKETITIVQLLSHRSGLAALDQKGLALTDHSAVVEALAAQPPNWIYDGSHGYGPRTFGFLIDELLRRLTDGEPLSLYWRRVFGIPLGLDLWFGLPQAELARTATLIPPHGTPPPSAFGRAYSDHTSLTRRAFMEPGGGFQMTAMNQPALRQAAIISSGAIATADALARFYSILAIQHNNPFFHATTRQLMETPMTSGQDRVFMEDTVFSAGCMLSGTYGIMGPGARNFGHPGAGGALAFADPEREWGFAYVPNKMHHGILTSLRTQRLVNALYFGVTT